MNPYDGGIEIRPRESVRGFRNVPATLDILATHFPLFPVLPGVLVLDTATCLAAELLAHDPGGAWRPERLDSVRWRHYVRPGDQLWVELAVTSWDGGAVELQARATVDGRLVASVGRMRMVPAAGPALGRSSPVVDTAPDLSGRSTPGGGK